MLKQLIIRNEAQVLLKLIRLALGTEPRKYFGEPIEPFPDNIDWKEVIRLSYEHKVPALAVDGLKSSHYNPFQGLDDEHAKELRPLFQSWFDDLFNAENSYTFYVEVLNTLCQIFTSYGLKTVILKGYGLNLLYPNPSHRGVGDIDIFLIDKNGNCAAEEGARIAKEVLHADVENETDTHHFQFTFKGILVEIHRELKGANIRNDNSELTEKEMLSLLSEGLSSTNSMVIPNVKFQTVYVLQHMYSHGCANYISLRQYCDLLVLSRCFPDMTKDNLVWTICSKAKIDKFLAALLPLMEQYFGMSSYWLQSSALKLDYENANMMMQNSVLSKSYEKRALPHIDRFYKDRWHYQFYYNKHWITKTFDAIITHLFK